MNYIGKMLGLILTAAVEQHYRKGRDARVEAFQNLKREQVAFLLAFGWREDGIGNWISPQGYDNYPRLRTFGHAVNSQLYTCHNTSKWSQR